jgi:PPOX class probable F420-dependent enzyme
VVPGGGRKERDVLKDELVGALLRARLIANLATVDPDGSAHVVGMWFLWEGGRLLLPTNRRTRKAKNVARDARVTVMIDDSRGGLDLRGVTLVGRAELLGGPEALELNRRIHLKYLTERGRDLEPVDRYLSTDDVTICLTPVRVSSWDLRRTPAGHELLRTGEFHVLMGVDD